MKNIFFLAPLLFLIGCATSNTGSLISENLALQEELNKYKMAESGELIGEYNRLQENFRKLIKKSEVSLVALEYLISQGWEIVQIEGFIEVKENEHDTFPKKLMIVKSESPFSRRTVYKEGFGGFFTTILPGRTLAKIDPWSIEILDNISGHQTFMKVKEL